MNYISVFIVSFTIALSGAIAPGPILATTIFESARRGWKSAPLLMLGHAFSEILMITFIIFGFSRFIHSPQVLKIVSVIGACILFYFGIKMLFSLRTFTLDLNDTRSNSSGLIMTGFTLSFTNPYWTIWWLTIGLGLLLGARQLGYTAVAVFFFGHILADLGWYTMVSLAVSKGRRFISEGVYKGIIITCALLLVGFAFWFAVKSF